MQKRETQPHISERMKRVRRAGTRPELAVRQQLRLLEIRFTSNASSLTGRPDLADRQTKWAIFVHGCFWHGHDGCRFATRPKSNKGFWERKLQTNQSRDRQNLKVLRRHGYVVLVVWECETRDVPKLLHKLKRFLSPVGRSRHPFESATRA